MGTDISAWIEVTFETLPHENEWITIVHASLLFNRDYDLFGCLFGVKNYANFRPLAPDRGIPKDASITVRNELFKEAENPSWILWSELKAVDWEEETLYPDDRLHEYHYNENGELIFDTKCAWSTAAEKATGLTMTQIQAPDHHWLDGQKWEFEGKIFRAERLKRKEVLHGAFSTVMDIMQVLGNRFGDENVRLVVWFYL
jgi:hypothetical protein